MTKSKKSNTFDNAASKRRITVQVRGYDKDGNYEKEETITFKVKNATLEEVKNSINNSLKKDFPSKKSDK